MALQGSIHSQVTPPRQHRVGHLLAEQSVMSLIPVNTSTSNALAIAHAKSRSPQSLSSLCKARNVYDEKESKISVIVQGQAWWPIAIAVERLMQKLAGQTHEQVPLADDAGSTGDGFCCMLGPGHGPQDYPSRRCASHGAVADVGIKQKCSR